MNLLRSYKKVPSSSPSPPPLLQPIFSFILLLLWFILFPTYMLWLRMGKNSSVIIPRENCIVYSLYSYFLLVFFFSPFTPSKYFAQFKIGLLTIGGERSENKRGANISNVYIGNHVNIYGCKLFVHLYHSCGLILNSWIV